MKIEAKEVLIENHIVYKVWWPDMFSPYGDGDFGGKYWFTLDVLFSRMNSWLHENETN